MNTVTGIVKRQANVRPLFRSQTVVLTHGDVCLSQFVRGRIPRVPFPKCCVRVGDADRYRDARRFPDEVPNPPVTRMRFLYSSEALQPRLGYEMQKTYCANAVIAFPSSRRFVLKAPLFRGTCPFAETSRSIYGVVEMSRETSPHWARIEI